MDNGLLCEPTTTNLAASVIDVTNGSLDYWFNCVGSGTFELSSKETYNHSNSIHLKDGTSLQLVEFDIKPKFNSIYTFSCMAFVVSGKCHLRLEEGTKPWPGLNSQPTSETGKWIKLSVTYKTTVKDSTLLHCRIYVGEGDDVYIDDIQLEARPYATSFTPTSRDAADRLTIAEWVVNKPAWTCEFDCTLNDKQVNYERPMSFITSGGSVYRYETSTYYSVVKGDNLKEVSVLDQTLTVPHKNAITFDSGTVTYYHDGKVVGTAQEKSGDKVLSAIMMGDCGRDPFNGCIKNFRFSSTVHTAEKIAADSKLDALPVEDDTVLYMPLKEDLSMYGHYND